MLPASLIEKREVQQTLHEGEEGFWEERMVQAEAECGHRRRRTGRSLGPDLLSHRPRGKLWLTEKTVGWQ